MTTTLGPLPRDPDQSPRTRRFMQRLVEIINSLWVTQQIQPTGNGTFTTFSTDQAVLSAQIFGMR